MSELVERLEIAAYTPELHEMSSGYHRYHPGKSDQTAKVIRSVLPAVLRALAEYQQAHADSSRTKAAPFMPDAWLSGYLAALGDTALGTGNLACEVGGEGR